MRNDRPQRICRSLHETFEISKRNEVRHMKANLDATFLGGNVGQSRMAFRVWEIVLKESGFKRIIDLGTYNGNFSAFLALWCKRCGADFHTFDVADWHRHIPNGDPFLEQLLGDSFVQGNILTDEKIISMIREIIARDGVSVVFCDDGRKEDEFKLYAPALKSGDIIGVHDWESEITSDQVGEMCDKLGLKRIVQRETDEEGWLAFWRRE